MKSNIISRIEKTSLRGAALILEIIIYLVIVALIAVAITSGVRAVRDLVFTSHAKGDIQNVQTWVEGKYSQDGKYTPTTIAKTGSVGDQPVLTEANGQRNSASVGTATFTTWGYKQTIYCIKVTSNSISDNEKDTFWLLSENQTKIYQSGTATSGAGVAGRPFPLVGPDVCGGLP